MEDSSETGVCWRRIGRGPFRIFVFSISFSGGQDSSKGILFRKPRGQFGVSPPGQAHTRGQGDHRLEISRLWEWASVHPITLVPLFRRSRWARKLGKRS